MIFIVGFVMWCISKMWYDVRADANMSEIEVFCGCVLSLVGIGCMLVSAAVTAVKYMP